MANNRVPAVKRERFWVALGEGSSVAAAARVAGVSAYSGYVWMAAAGQPLPSGRARRRRATLEDRELFWAELRAGASIAAAARAAGVSKDAGRYWITQAGGMRPATVNPTLESMVSAGRGALSWVDRCRIEDLVVAHYRPAQIARLLGRARSTIARELRRGVPAQGGRYRAQVAQDAVDTGRRRPKERRIAAGSALYAEVVRRLRLCHSPEQIAGCLRVDFPDDPEMWVSHETIYQALYVQARGGLKAEVKRGLRTGRIRRKPQGRSPRPGPIKDAVSISERPAEAEDRAVPGHWEGDLIIGAHGASAIGTLVERTTGFVMLLHLPGDHTAQTVATAMSGAVPQIPEILRRSLTWDRGSEMALHTAITEATGLPIYFADPHSPWQRGSNENTNGLLRQYFPKGTDLSEHGPGILDNVAAELNARPRKRHGWLTPAAKLDELLRSDPSDPVAATG
ncbi:IS30 family transposase [Gordonia sp. (in: high G+C Gram-positive bacteria)]|uniref:IS30 family transposase n=1 Tax=Gordonia sp. (in: high G+C Gram-positive bacteria) TaxID=84139 RepID=UPI00257C8703|nr:IS30 family transposase [Gordonia sp. (in: high G+C Gram-positive bacteria)]